jgi:hypothetical protein
MPDKFFSMAETSLRILIGERLEAGRARGDEPEKIAPSLQTYGDPPPENIYLHFLMLDAPALD